MKVPLHHRKSAFTLIETMMVIATSTILMGVVLSSHIYGLKMSSRVQIKLNASDDARQTMSSLIQDVRAAHRLRIGTGTLNSFTDAADGSDQKGSALQIYHSSNTNQWVRFYYDSADNSLRRTTNGATSSLVSANSITNDVAVFTLEDSEGDGFTNRVPIAMVRINLSFTKLKNPQVVIAPGSRLDFYQIETRITPRITL